MSQPTISLALISNDGAENMAQCLGSVVGHVDEIVIADTGMSDEARAICVRYGASVYQFDHRSHPEAFFIDSAEECGKFLAPGPYSNEYALGDFAAARNESFRHATKDYVMWMDADDVLDGAEHVRSVVSAMETHNQGMGFLAYNYAQDHLGRVFYRQWRERIFKRGSASWHQPVHEVLMPNAPVGPPARFEVPVFQHRRKADRKGIAHRNYKILLRQVWQQKQRGGDVDPRTLFYLGQEARFVEPMRAVGFYEEYLQKSGWPEERAAAHCAIGALLEYGVLGFTPEQAYAHANREYAAAAVEMPDNPDGLFGLARIAYHRRRWQDCINYTERAFKIGNTDSMLGANPMDRLYRPHFFYNFALAQVGRLDEAITSCSEALKVMPDDPGIPGGASGMLTLNLKNYRALKEQQTQKEPIPMQGKIVAQIDKNEDLDAPPLQIPNDALVIWSMQIWKKLRAEGDVEKMRNFLASLPSAVTADPIVGRMFERTGASETLSMDSVKWVACGRVPLPHEAAIIARNVRAATPIVFGKDIILYVGPGPEPWDPNTPKTKGLGGSETAVIEMARELTKLGHRCVVYAEAMGTFDGVEYRHYSTFNGGKCDVFIASRTPWAVEAPVDARLKLLWVHDVHCGPASPQMERWLMKFDRVMCLSNWHREFFCKTYPTLDQSRVVVTRNGIDAARFEGPLPKKENILAFTSSPNRGLLTLLSYVPWVRQRVPDAVVHGMYGLNTWKQFAQQRGDANELAEIDRYQRAIDDAVKAGYLVWHGKATQTQVAELFKRAKVHGYAGATPEPFPETYCISALEAQAAGAVVIGTKWAGLPETVKAGFLIEPSPTYGREWVDAAVLMLTDETARQQIADQARPWALTQTWALLARDWSAMFDRVIGETESSPLPMWRSA